VIEYRESQYFVLAVNIIEIDWILLMKWVALQQVEIASLRKRHSFGWGDDPNAKKKEKTIQKKVQDVLVKIRRRFPSRNEVVASFLLFMAAAPAIIANPLLRILYFLFIRYAVDKFILNAVTDGKS